MIDITPEIVKAQYDECQRHHLQRELTAANKTIVALSEALTEATDALSEEEWPDVYEALKLHAPAIEKARGG